MIEPILAILCVILACLYVLEKKVSGYYKESSKIWLDCYNSERDKRIEEIAKISKETHEEWQRQERKIDSLKIQCRRWRDKYLELKEVK